MHIQPPPPPPLPPPPPPLPPPPPFPFQKRGRAMNSAKVTLPPSSPPSSSPFPLWCSCKASLFFSVTAADFPNKIEEKEEGCNKEGGVILQGGGFGKREGEREIDSSCFAALHDLFF